MALDQYYFNSIQIELVKKKYYNANKVEAVLEDIRRQAAALTEENAQLRRQLGERNDLRAELGEAAYSAQEVYRLIIDKAEQQAEAIRAEAEEYRRSVRLEAQHRSDYAVRLVESCLKLVRERQQAALDELDGAWQSFLCGLPEEEPPEEPESVPPDLSEKVDSIARELRALEEP